VTGLRGVLERQPPRRRAGRGRWWLTVLVLVLGVAAVVVALACTVAS
jgi:hypothetical protein